MPDFRQNHLRVIFQGFTKMLNVKKSTPAALRSAARSQIERGMPMQAREYLMEALGRDTGDHEALALLAESYALQGQKMQAFSFYVLAVNAAPHEISYKEKFIRAAETVAMDKYNADAERAILSCLESAHALDEVKLRSVWFTHLYTIPDFLAAYSFTGKTFISSGVDDVYGQIATLKPLLTPFFLSGIRKFVIFRPIFEDFITAIRKKLHDDFVRGFKELSAEEFTTLASAIGCYAFNTDYILQTTSAEEATVADIARKAEKGDLPPAAIALLSAYRPLYTLANRNSVAGEFTGHPDLRHVVRQQMTMHADIEAEAAKIEAITPIDHAVSLEVQKQYEEFPYPRWESLGNLDMIRGWKMGGEEQRLIGDRLTRGKVKILVAGCGTGVETIVYANTFPKAEVLAVDLSRSSLSYAMMKAGALGVTNITFRQADILNLGVLQDKFDLIISGGVLHHIADPVRAWGVLCGLLKDDGLMLIALYSKIARECILRTRALIAEKKIGHDTASMKDFRRRSVDLLPREDLVKLADYADYYYLNMYRDMLFHVQETDYDLRELQAIVRDLNLKLVRMQVPPSIRDLYAQMFPAAPNTDTFENWDALERDNKNAFIGMYAFWLKKMS